MTHNQSAQTAFAGVERGHLQQMAELMDHDSQVHGVHPGFYRDQEFRFRLYWKCAAFRPERGFKIQLFGESKVDGEERAQFLPLLVARNVALAEARYLQRSR
jgi:hypothetical protein